MFKHYKPKELYEKKVKIERFLSREGICSRTEAEIYAKEGKIKINDMAVFDVTKRFDPHSEKISIDESVLSKESKDFVLCALYKPIGILSQAMAGKIRSANTLLISTSYASFIFGSSDKSAYVSKNKMSFFPLGKLEKEYHGLLLMTNNKSWIRGVATKKITVEREYIVKIDKPFLRKEIDKIYKGFWSDDVLVKPVKVEIEEPTQIRLVLKTDYKNQIYRLMSKVGCRVVEATCVRIDNFEIGTLKPGQWVIFDSLKKLGNSGFKL